jgi:hypothetical protein
VFDEKNKSSEISLDCPLKILLCIDVHLNGCMYSVQMMDPCTNIRFVIRDVSAIVGLTDRCGDRRGVVDMYDIQ